MYEEKFGDGTQYTRLEAEDYEKIAGKRIKGRGKINGYTIAAGELHPCIVHVDGGEDITAEELPLVDFDGRHGFVDV